MLEKKSDERWGTEEAYQQYKRETWIFFLLPARRGDSAVVTPKPTGVAAVPEVPATGLSTLGA